MRSFLVSSEIYFSAPHKIQMIFFLLFIPLLHFSNFDPFYRYSDHVAELFFLQTGGNMMEYPVWRKKANTPQFLNFMKSYRLEPPPLEESSSSSVSAESAAAQHRAPAIASTHTLANQPLGAEIKIPGVGVTPVAVSTTLPAAVVQLSQQGMFTLLVVLFTTLDKITTQKTHETN